MSNSNYLQSQQWNQFCRHWHNSDLPKNCLGCGSTEHIKLTHATYERFGRELLNDVAPFCWPCYKLFFERFTQADMTGVDNLPGRLADVFDVTFAEAKIRVAPFLKKLEHLKPPKKKKTDNRRGSQYLGGESWWKEKKAEKYRRR